MFQYDLCEIEIKRTFPFKITSKTIKHLGRNLIKEGKNLHIENYKTFMQERKDERYHVYGLEGLILLKCPYDPKPSIDSI